MLALARHLEPRSRPEGARDVAHQLTFVGIAEHPYGLAAPSAPRNLSLTGRRHGKSAVVVIRDYSVHIGHDTINVEILWGYVQTPPPQAVLQQFDRVLTDLTTELAEAL
ncbi:hypothetical protein AB0F52_14855 [Amycolatopsis sp. NPDC024027]|uniref:hypothetical protein n=1 Tax=Amycolatopsis sp. NPDC024027 TaxID=3154327 RepID=UPI0033D3289A